MGIKNPMQHSKFFNSIALQNQLVIIMSELKIIFSQKVNFSSFHKSECKFRKKRVSSQDLNIIDVASKINKMLHCV